MQPPVVNQEATNTEDEALARRIWRYQLNRHNGEAEPFPSERELAHRLGVTRHAIRKGLDVLEQSGRLVRLGNRGVMPATGVALDGGRSTGLKCINFLRSNAFAAGPLQWLLDDHLAGYTAALEAHDIKTRFVSCDDDVMDYESMFWPAAPLRQQGCVLVSRNMPALLSWLTDHQVPFVVQYPYGYDLGTRPPHYRVFANKTGGAFAATQYLIELGHREIGFAGNAPPNLYDKSVYEGYRSAMQVHAREIRDEWVWPIHTNYPDVALEAIRERFDPDCLPTAFATANDVTALALLQVARQRGLRVPEDLSIVGYNDQLEAGESTPPLTTVRKPRQRLAQRAVELLFEAAENGEPPAEPEVLDCELIVRGTTGPPREPA